MSYLIINTVGSEGYTFEVSSSRPYTLAIISPSNSDKFKLEFLSPSGSCIPSGVKGTFHGPAIFVEYDGNETIPSDHVWELKLEKTETLMFYANPQELLKPILSGEYDPNLEEILG